MATINDFKLVNIKSKNYSNYLPFDSSASDETRARIGFYFLALECITGISDQSTLDGMILDNEYWNIFKKTSNDDQGIDAIYIDHDTHTINFFNFKYRNSFNPDRTQGVNTITDSAKLLTFIRNSSTQGLNGATLNKTEEVLKCLNSDEIWHMKLYLVSNEAKPAILENTCADSFKEVYDLDIISVVLDDIVAYISDLPDDISANFIVNNDSIMTYELNTFSSAKSYLVKMTLADIIRITCSDKGLRRDSACEYNKIKDKKLEMGLLFDNVRGYLGETKYNKNIIDTIKEEPNKFFLYNNGITITTKNISARSINGNRKTAIEISGFQIVNGGQTLRSIYEFSEKNFDEEKLATAEILVRIFQTETDSELKNSIAEYTNSQNAISTIDLKSVSNLQLKLEKYLAENGILYVRKNGDVGEKDKNYSNRIGMEKVAQILYTWEGYPDRATNQKRYLFDKYYDQIFNPDIDFDNVLTTINTYFSIEKEYTKSKYDGTLQKCLYVLYIISKLKDKSIQDCIEILENSIKDYLPDEEISPARKMIYKAFKLHLDKKIE